LLYPDPNEQEYRLRASWQQTWNKAGCRAIHSVMVLVMIVAFFVEILGPIAMPREEGEGLASMVGVASTPELKRRKVVYKLMLADPAPENIYPDGIVSWPFWSPSRLGRRGLGHG
jgi:hypothetical protein